MGCLVCLSTILPRGWVVVVVLKEFHLLWYGLEHGSDPPSPLCYHHSVVGVENGHKFSAGENLWFSAAGPFGRRTSLQLVYMLRRSKLLLPLHCAGVSRPPSGVRSPSVCSVCMPCVSTHRVWGSHVL